MAELHHYSGKTTAEITSLAELGIGGQGIVKPATEQPGNSFRYAYQNLSTAQFQQLCGALLKNEFRGVQCYPVGMADEGIDATSQGDVVYQVKWTSKVQQDPATWLQNTMEAERSKVEKLIKHNRISRYVLMTSVASTTTATGTGSLQKLDGFRAKLEKELGISVECWWQADMDALMDKAPDAIKWSFPQVLVGTDAMRYLMHASHVEAEATQMRDTMTQVMATQGEEDSRVKFSQLDMDHINVADLFVDVHASLVSPPSRASEEVHRQQLHQTHQEGGALQYLLETNMPLTYLLGVPGQGKSTLGQYLSQVHRAAILQTGDREEPQYSGTEVVSPKLPFRVDLKDFAAWIDGRDPYGHDGPPTKPKRKGKRHRSLELFLADFCVFYSGGRSVAVEQIQSLLERYPTLLVLDGLDEIANPKLREIVVEQIDATAIRMSRTTKWRTFQILVTARPNASYLAEPDKTTFETLQLLPLDKDLRDEFFRKWQRVNQVPSRDARKLKRIFEDRTALDHVATLADNPMQLTILLYLIRRKGEAVPTSRTDLYSHYLSTLLDREVDRQQIERHQIPRVEEVTSFLGWHLHTGVGSDTSAGRMSRRDMESTMFLYFRSLEASSEDVEDLFRAASDRFWALTSKVEGTFEFAVQPVREFFAARFLAEWAGRDRKDPLNKRDVLVELIKRPFWLNTLQFYAGFASPNELGSLRYGIEDALDGLCHPLQERVGTWALLNDGIFANDPKVQNDVVRQLTDDLSIVLLSDPRVSATHFPPLALETGGNHLATELMKEIKQNPSDPLTEARVTALRQRTALPRNAFREWWQPQMLEHLGKPEQNAWISVGTTYGVPALDVEHVKTLRLVSSRDHQYALRIGASPDPGTETDQALLQSVLDGACSDVQTSSNSEAGALLRAMRPQWYHQTTDAMRDGPPLGAGHLWISERMRNSRSSAFKRLVEIDERYEKLKKASPFGARGRKGTTEPWQLSAQVLRDMHGPSLLSAEIAVAGAASSGTRPEGSAAPNGEPFGPNVDYGTFVMQVHKRPNSQWWAEAYEQYNDSLSRSTWVLGLLATADCDVIADHLPKIDGHVVALGEEEFDALAAASSRLGLSTSSRRLERTVLSIASTCSPRTSLLVTHFVASVDAHPDGLSGLVESHLLEMASADPSAWAVVRAVAGRGLSSPNEDLLDALTKAGPQAILQWDMEHAWRTMQAEWAKRTILSPASYPRAWVRVAEQAWSEIREEPALEKVAIAEGWVSKVVPS